MKDFQKKDLFTIPNIIGYVRILLIPVFCWVYIRAETPQQYMAAALIVLFSSFTDLFDGMIARKFNQVTELGKILDPVADKLTHGAMALCLLTRYRLMWVLLAVMALKEGYMLVMGLKYLKRGKMMNGAMWYGKICTAVLFAGMVLLFFDYGMKVQTANFIILIMIAVMLAALVLYIRFYSQMKEK